jgi:nucleoredoxin
MTDDGRSVILKENAMEKYPWKPVPMGAHVFGETLLKGKEEISVADAFADKDAIAIYFSAHWCPPCRGFTPKLAEQHKALKDAGKKFEIIFASSDKNQEAFDEYYAEMPWLALPYK